MKRFLKWLTRIDNFNRIIVFLSMSLFIVVPAWLLYLMNEQNYSLDIIVPSITLLGILLGNGLLVGYRPLRTTWLYFLICIVSLPILYHSINLSILQFPLNTRAIFWICMVYSIIGFLINLLYFIQSSRRKSKSELNERTNNDHAYDFLGGQANNKVIADKIEKIESTRLLGKMKAGLNKTKFSRLTRVVSFLFSYIVALIYFFGTIQIESLQSNYLAILLFLFILIEPVCLIASILYPIDFKYIYYFNGMFLLITATIVSRTYQFSPIMLIFSTIAIGLSFLATLIVEGRTWSGDKPD